MNAEPGAQLLNSVRRSVGVPITIEEMRSRRWASITFAGERHELAFSIDGEEAEEAASRFTLGIETADLPMKGHILADIKIVGEERRHGHVALRLEALTVEND